MADITLEAIVARGLVEEISRNLNESLQLQKKLLSIQSKSGEIKQTDLIKDLRIAPDTLKKWEENGLQRIQRGGLAFYLLEDLHKFNY